MVSVVPRASRRGANEKQPILALEGPPGFAVSANDTVLFLRHLNRLAAPFRDGRRRLELNREPHGRHDLGVAATGNAVLIVPEPDKRSGSMPVHADGMRVHRAGDASGFHPREHSPQNLVARPTRPYF